MNDPKNLPPDGFWSGQHAIVVGGGPSLKDFNFEILKGIPRVIVVNRAFLNVPDADIFFTEDVRFISRFAHWDRFKSFKGVKLVHVLDDAYLPDLEAVREQIVVIRRKRQDKFWSSSFEDGLSVSSNSAVGAVNVADILGAKTIFLLGMDCRPGQSNEVNYHSDYPESWRIHPTQLDSFASDWKHWVKLKCKSQIVNVINPQLVSAIDCFPTLNYENFYTWILGRAGLVGHGVGG